MRQSESVGNQRAPAPIARLCAACAANNLGFCGAFGRPPQQDDRARLPEIEASVHRVSARKVILRERDLYDVVPVLREGWAACLLALPDGRRQILSFLLPGDYFSTAFLFEPAGQCVVEAITDVQYRTFKRTDLMDAIYRQPQLIQPLSKAWVTEKMQAIS